MKTIKMIAVLVFACTSMQLTAMSSNKKNVRLWEAAKSGDYEQAKGLLEQGANPDFMHREAGFTPLMIAAFYYHPDMVKLLLEHGADVFMYEPFDMRALLTQRTALMLAIRPSCNEEQLRAQLPEKTIYALLATIPLADRKKILAMKKDINEMRDTAQAALLRIQPVIPKDIRKMIMQRITQEPINELVTNQMERVNRMLTQKSGGQFTAYDFAKDSSSPCGPAIARILDPNDAVEQEKIRKMVRNNVKRILFGEPVEAKLFKISELENDHPKPMDTGE